MSEAKQARAFDVLDAFEGLFTLVKRSPTLDGAVPMRVAQACVPLLEGNAFGFQVKLERPLLIERRIGRAPLIREESLTGRKVPLERLHAAALPRLLAQGLVPRRSEWHRAFQDRPWHVHDSIVWLWTGWLLRPIDGVWLRVSATANRRNALVDIEESFIADDGLLVPLVLGITPRWPKGSSVVRLEGEIATIAPMRPGVAIESRSLSAAKELGQAHVAFYDASYFATKRGEVTKKYRHMLGRAKERSRERLGHDEPSVVAPIAACELDIEHGRALLSARWPRPQTDRSRPGVTRIVFRNPLDFSVTWDGHTVVPTLDARALERCAQAVERTFTEVYGQGFVEKHRGALWYLTKYYTPHPPGEPHFFVKPFAFVRTPESWSSLLEGVHGEGYDVMRGVVHTDLFHATPAVFQLRVLGECVRVAAGTPLLRVHPVPRTLLSTSYQRIDWADR